MDTMKKIYAVILLLALLLGGAAATTVAAEALPSPQDEALLSLINEARKNPLATAASLGMDPEKILGDLPGMEKILKEGLPALAWNANLADAAGAHTADMFARGYYASVSPDGTGHEERIRATGYPAAATGESLGMLLFANFISPDEAVKLIFRYMFQDELDPGRTEKRTILDPSLKEAGLSVQSGNLRLGSALWNVYLATVDFGAVLSTQEAHEAGLLWLINQARANPLGVAESLGIETAAFLEKRPELRAFFEKGLAPLTINESLSSASAAHLSDMRGNRYYGKISLDGRTYRDRIEASGYVFDALGESLGITWFTDPIIPYVAIDRVFEVMLRNELEPSNSGNLTILDPGMTEAGIAFGLVSLRSENEDANVYVAVCDVGMPPTADAVGQ
jgi:uncharacterized protein YkwD